jgi:non-ribosomal peptide synthetase component F
MSHPAEWPLGDVVARSYPGPTSPFVPFPPEAIEQSIPTRFEEQVKKNGQRTAIQSERGELSYENLNLAANRVARAILAARGPGAQPVAFLLESGLAQIVALLGILKAGKIYLPLDVTFPNSRIAVLLEETQPAVFLTDNANATRALELNGSARPLINLDALGSESAENPAS